MRTRIIIRNKEIGEIVEDFARRNYGVFYGRNINDIIDEFGVKYPILFNYEDKGSMLGWDNYNSKDRPGDIRLDASTQFGEIIKLLTKPKAIEVVLDEANVILVSKEGIKFGKYSFPLSVIDKLVEARKSLEACSS